MKAILGMIFVCAILQVEGNVQQEILFEGKTKIVRKYSQNSNLAVFESKNDITAGDGAKHDVIPEKGKFANETTCHVFQFLADQGIPVAFLRQLDDRSFLGIVCQMVPYEVVIRREAHGSYLKRYPHLEKGALLPDLIVEFYLKTKDRVWMEHSLPKDDPLVLFTQKGAELFLPHIPIEEQKPFLVLDEYPLKGEKELFKQIESLARKTFLLLENAWRLEGARLVDCKIEFGINPLGELVLADVIDNDSWRVIQEGNYIDKQIYRDGGSLDHVIRLYQQVCESTSHFKDVYKGDVVNN